MKKTRNKSAIEDALDAVHASTSSIEVSLIQLRAAVARATERCVRVTVGDRVILRENYAWQCLAFLQVQPGVTIKKTYKSVVTYDEREETQDVTTTCVAFIAGEHVVLVNHDQAMKFLQELSAWVQERDPSKVWLAKLREAVLIRVAGR